jgi:hypothetical protein
MRKTLTAAAAFLAIALAPAPAWAWGSAAHRFIMRRAIELLPPELKPFFLEHRDEVVVRVIDPDTWRSVGWEDDPNHFLDFGADEYGTFPFTDLPRALDAALEKFGAATIERNGRLPWRYAEMSGNLRRVFEAFTRPGPYTVMDTILFAGVSSHYIQDAHQPFHGTINYDGQLSGQRGIHARFERDLFERFESRLRVTPPPVKAITSPRDTAFDTLLDSYQLVDTLLAADRAAAAGRTEYDDVYYEKFFTAVQTVLERRLGESISATAGSILGAWELAGKPPLRLRDARPIQRIDSSPR